MIRLTALMVFVALAAPVLTAQQPARARPQTQQMQFRAEEAVFIRELGAVIVEEGGKLRVKFIPPKDRRPKEVAAEDIESGDEVGMANGKKISTASELRKSYDESAIGREFKLGVRRDGQLHIVTLLKKDPNEAMMGGTMIVGGNDDRSRVFPALGIGLEQLEKKVIIEKAFPNILKGLREGDQVESLNGRKIATVEDFAKELDASNIGSDLNFGLIRNGKSISYSAPKPKPQGTMIIRNN